MPVTVIDGKNCAKTIAEVLGVASIANMYDSKNVDWDTPPFVKVGNVYSSLTILGDTSWSYIAKKEAKTNFKVYSGRHGNVINPISSQGILSSHEEAHGKDDPTDPALDRARATPFGVRVQVVDVRADEFRTSKGLQGKINADLTAGNAVILAWCYGIFTFIESSTLGSGEDPSNSSHSHYNTWSQAVTMKISEIVARDWKWVP